MMTREWRTRRHHIQFDQNLIFIIIECLFTAVQCKYKNIYIIIALCQSVFSIIIILLLLRNMGEGRKEGRKEKNK